MSILQKKNQYTIRKKIESVSIDGVFRDCKKKFESKDDDFNVNYACANMCVSICAFVHVFWLKNDLEIIQ